MDAEMAFWKSTGTYVNEVPLPRANILSGMWIFRVKQPPGSPPFFKARCVARGFSQRQGVDFFHTFSPTLKMTTLRVLLHVAAQRDYELHLHDFCTAFLQGSLHEEIWLRCPPGFTGSFPAGTQWSLWRPVYGLRQAPCEWHDTLRTTLAALDDLVFATADTEALAHVKSELQKRHTCTDLGELTSNLGLRITRDRAQRTITLTQSHMVHQVLQRFGFTYSSPQSTPLPTGHSLSAPPSDESVEPSGPYPELMGCLMYLMTCTRPDLAYPLSLLAGYVAPGRHRKVHWDAAKRVLRYLCSTSGMGLVLGGRARVVLTGHADASWVDELATQRSSQGYTFSLGSGSVSWRSTRSSSVLSSSCEAEIYAGAMAAQELRWLTYLLTDLGEAPCSPPVLYVDNKAMLALCQEHRLEHRTKHIALRYFLARELQQRGQLHLAYVASQANTADVFTKALQPCDHQPCFAFLDWSCDLLFSPNLPMGVSQSRLPRFLTSLRRLALPASRVGSTLPPTTAPLHTLHLDVWGPSPVLGPRQERYFLIVVDDYSRYTTVFTLRRKADVCTVHSSPPHRLVPIMSKGAGGAVAEGEGTGDAGSRCASSGGVGGVRVETTPEEDTAVLTQWPRPASHPGFLSVPQFPPSSPPRPAAAEPRGVPARGTGIPGGVVGGGSGSGVAGAENTSTPMPTPRTIRFLTRVQRLDRLEREE
ncbi:unnamed protein product [Closterium sp. NIES-53]